MIERHRRLGLEKPTPNKHRNVPRQISLILIRLIFKEVIFIFSSTRNGKIKQYAT